MIDSMLMSFDFPCAALDISGLTGYLATFIYLVLAVIAVWGAFCVIMVWMALGFYGIQAYQGKRFAIPGLTSFLTDQGWLH